MAPETPLADFIQMLYSMQPPVKTLSYQGRSPNGLVFGPYTPAFAPYRLVFGPCRLEFSSCRGVFGLYRVVFGQDKLVVGLYRVACG